ncbi:hypothetical protein [Kordia jejudonensis]|uniref:hypothetical protein n=1 Tax=Kordia jejudonensis TaxID=1348245 RepID=UPI0012E0B0C7|nr:hypothetical protein [Kordia jejudonensis]
MKTDSKLSRNDNWDTGITDYLIIHLSFNDVKRCFANYVTKRSFFNDILKDS